MAAMIEVADLAIGFSRNAPPVLADVNLRVERGAFAAIVGASGAGKSTLLRAIAGLVEPSRGTIRRMIEVGPKRRAVAIVFQEARLMPWRMVEANVALGLEGLPLTRPERARRGAEALALVGLQDLRDRWPHQLSGGQRQRVGIARALAVAPELLLMDEPFSALDAITRRGLQDELLRIWAATRTTILFVTHDIDEATYLADEVLLLGGAPAQIIASHPVTAPRPRRREDSALAALSGRVRSELSELMQEGAGI